MSTPGKAKIDGVLLMKHGQEFNGMVIDLKGLTLPDQPIPVFHNFDHRLPLGIASDLRVTEEGLVGAIEVQSGLSLSVTEIEEVDGVKHIKKANLRAISTGVAPSE